MIFYGRSRVVRLRLYTTLATDQAASVEVIVSEASDLAGEVGRGSPAPGRRQATRREHWGGSCKSGVEGNRMQNLHIKVRDQDIVVTMPGTSLRVVYRKPHRGSQLVARLDYFQDQQKGPITRAEFLDRALKAANDKARELGWFV